MVDYKAKYEAELALRLKAEERGKVKLKATENHQKGVFGLKGDGLGRSGANFSPEGWKSIRAALESVDPGSSIGLKLQDDELCEGMEANRKTWYDSEEYKAQAAETNRKRSAYNDAKKNAA